MKRRFVVFIFGVILALSVGTRLPAQDASNLHTLSIAPFSGDKTTIPFWQTDMGQGLAEMLIESLESGDRKFQVLEMPETTGQPAEPAPKGANSAGDEKSSAKKSGKNGDAGPEKSDADNAASTGKPNTPMVADFTFYADVTEFTMKTNSSKIGDFFSSSKFGGLGGGLINAHIEIAWRIVDTGAHKVVKRGITVCSANGSELEISSAATTNTPASAVAKAAAVPPTAAVTNKTMAMFNNFFGGIGKAFSGSSSGGSNGSGASASSGTTAAAPRKSATSSADAGGAAAGTDSETYGYANPAFITSALGKASAKAVTNIIEQLAAYQFPEPERIATLQNTPGKILAVVDNDTIIVSLGSNQGFKAGDHLKLYETSDIKDDKGNVVFTDEKMVGELTLSEVQEDKSRGSYAGDSKVQQGWLVKAR